MPKFPYRCANVNVGPKNALQSEAELDSRKHANIFHILSRVRKYYLQLQGNLSITDNHHGHSETFQLGFGTSQDLIYSYMMNTHIQIQLSQFVEKQSCTRLRAGCFIIQLHSITQTFMEQDACFKKIFF